MNVWAISDLHLSFARPERRERFAARWRDHAAHIERNWREAVGPGDLVLLPGDLSMAQNHRDLQPDLAWLERLPGTKVLAPGNHDRWWNGAQAIRPLLRRSMLAVDGDAVDNPRFDRLRHDRCARRQPIPTCRRGSPLSTAKYVRWNRRLRGPPSFESIPPLRSTSSGIIPPSTPIHGPVRASSDSNKPT